MQLRSGRIMVNGSYQKKVTGKKRILEANCGSGDQVLDGIENDDGEPQQKRHKPCDNGLTNKIGNKCNSKSKQQSNCSDVQNDSNESKHKNINKNKIENKNINNDKSDNCNSSDNSNNNGNNNRHSSESKQKENKDNTSRKKNKNKSNSKSDSDNDVDSKDEQDKQEDQDIDVENNDSININNNCDNRIATPTPKKVCLTGFEDEFANDLISKGKELGLDVSKIYNKEETDITISNIINDYKHPKITIKLLASLIHSKPIVQDRYITDSHDKQKLLDFGDYLCNYRPMGNNNIFSPYWFLFGPTQTKRQKLQMIIQAAGGILCSSKADQFIMDKNLTNRRILILKNDFSKEMARKYSKKFNCRTVQENWIIHSIYMADYFDDKWQTDLTPITKAKSLDDYDLCLLPDDHESSNEEQDSDHHQEE